MGWVARFRLATVVAGLALWPGGLPAEPGHARFQFPVLTGSPIPFFTDPADVQEYQRWGLNCGYLTITKKTTREELLRTAETAHRAGMDVLVWNCIGADAFCERFRDVPIDVYYYDEPGFSGPWFGGDYHQGGYKGYTDRHREQFNQYLRRRYDEKTLSDLFGIPSGAVPELPQDGLAPSVRKDNRPNPRLWYEFVLWHNLFVRDELRTISEQVRKAIPGIATFPCLSPCYLEAGPRYAGVDYTLLAREPLFERVQIDPYVHIRMNSEYWVSYIISLMRTACRGKPLDSWTCTWHGYGTKPIDMFQGPMCAFAQGTDGYCFWAYHHATQADWKPDYKERWSEIRRALRFIQEHAAVTRLSPRNEVALWLPHHCYFVKYFDAPWTKHGGVWGSGYFTERTYYTLARAHVPADVIVPALGEEAGLKEELAPYRVVLLPEASYLGDTEISILREWVKGGGTLIATGPLATHDQFGVPRASAALADVTGVTYGEEKPRKSLKITAADGLLPSVKSGTVIQCRGWPVESYLAIDRAKVTYEGTGSHAENMKTFRYAVDRLREWDGKASCLVPRGATVLGTWDDGSPALAVNSVGAGKAIACAAVDATIGYELCGWQDPERVRLVRDLCHAGARLPETDLPEDVELHILWGETLMAVTLFNHGASPARASRVTIPMAAVPRSVRCDSPEGEMPIRHTFHEGRLTLEVPEFLDFTLCEIELGNAPP